MIENETPRQLTPAPASTIVKHLTASNRILSTGDTSVEYMYSLARAAADMPCIRT